MQETEKKNLVGLLASKAVKEFQLAGGGLPITLAIENIATYWATSGHGSKSCIKTVDAHFLYLKNRYNEVDTWVKDNSATN